MSIYQSFHHRQQQRETRSLATNTAELNHRPLPPTSTAVGAGRPGHLDSDRVLPPLATASDGSKFVPFWKRTQQQQPPAHLPVPSQQVVPQQQPSTAPSPRKKWLTQAEMGMVSPAIIPLPIPTARTSTTSTTTTTTNTSTTTNNNVGTTVSSSGSGITASSVTGRTFNYNYNNYNHHVHQFNQPPSAPNSRHSIVNQPGAGPPNNSVVVDQARKHMSWHGRAPAAYAGHPVQHQIQEDEGTSEEEEATEEEDESSSVPPSPQYGILDLPARGHRRTQSHPHTVSSAIRDVGMHKQKKKVHLDPGLPKPPAVLVLQTPSHRKGDYTPAYAYEYSLKHDRDIDGRHTHGERKKGRRGHLREEESEDEDESEESEESEDLPPPKKKKSKMKNGEKKSVKTKASKSKAKSKGKPKEKQKKLKSRGLRDEEDESEEDESNEDEEGKEGEEENEDEEDESDHEVRKKPRKRATEAPKSKKKTPEMSLQLASMNIKGNQTSQPLLHHRQSRSEDYTWQSQSTVSRNTPGGSSNGWPAGLPRLPRTPGTPADGMPPGSSFAPGSASPVKRDAGYFDYQPNQQPHAQPYSHPQPGTRPSTRSSQGLYTPMTRTSNSSSTPVSTTSTNSTPVTSYASSASGQPRPLNTGQGYMNLDDPPPTSLRRSPSPGYSSSSHSYSYSRPLPQVNTNQPSNYGSSPSSSPLKAYEQIRSRVEQSQTQQVQSQSVTQPQARMQIHPPQPQPPETARRYTQPLAGASNFRSSQAFWQEQAQQQQQPQQSPYHPHPSQHRPLPPTISGGSSLINGYGTADGYRNVQAPVSSAPAPAPAHVLSAPTRRRDLPPQPAQGRERAQEIWKEAMERQALRAQPVQHQPPSQLQQQQQLQWRAHPVQPAPGHFPPHIQQVQQGMPQQPRRPPLPQPSLSQQQRYHLQPGSSHQQPLQHSQPAVPSIQQYRQPIIQHLPQTQQPQQHPSQHQPNHVSQHPPQPPPARPRQQPLPPQPRPQPQPPQTQQRQPQPPNPPQAQMNVYRPPSLPVESPLPVGGRDKVADIPRMGKAASVVGSVSSGYGSGGNLSASDSDAESSRGPSSNVGPQIVVNVLGDDRGNRDKMGSKSPLVHGASQVSSPQMPVIHVQGEGEGPPSAPKVQVFGVPDINIDGPEEASSSVGGGGIPSISISGETSNNTNNTNNTSRSRPQSQPVPEIRSPQQRAKSVPALADRTTGTHVVQTRPQASGLSCGGCGGSIIGRIVSAMGVHWHPECFRCSVCDTLLEHVSSYEHEGKPYCHLDYHEHFAPRCYHCETAIVEERFISLDDPALGLRTYHEQHFFCAECGDPFLTPSSEHLEGGEGGEKRSGELALSGDGEFESDNVGFTVYRGHPYCESCHVRLRFPKCKRCKKSIKDGDRAVEALGGKWCWACFLCEGCQKPFEDPAFFQRGEKPYCEPCFSVMLRNEV